MVPTTHVSPGASLGRWDCRTWDLFYVQPSSLALKCLSMYRAISKEVFGGSLVQKEQKSMCHYVNCTVPVRFMPNCMHNQERSSQILGWTNDFCHLETTHPRWCEKMQQAFSLLLVCCYPCWRYVSVNRELKWDSLRELLMEICWACSGEKQRGRATAHSWEPAAPARRWRDCREQQGTAASQATEPRKIFLGIQRRLFTV